MKTHYLNFFKKAYFKACKKENHANKSVDNKNLSRRYFLKNISAFAAGSLIYPSLATLESCLPQQNNTSKINIAIIGGGISGLSTAYFLQKNNIECSVFEASSRIGGRMFSINNWAGDGLTTDLGAEFVCEYHQDLIQLSKELNIELYDLRKDELFNQAPSFFIEGKKRTFNDFVKGLQPAVKKINCDLQELDFAFTYKNVPKKIKELDQISIKQYLDLLNLELWVKKLLCVIFEAEYGMDAQEQSCLNMLCVLKLPKPNDINFEILGENYEVLKIKDGSQTLANAVYEKIKNKVFLNHYLTQYNINKQGEYELFFNNENSSKTFNYIVFTLPFKVLRNISTNILYPTYKKDAIDNMGYGNNCKTIFGFNQAVWRNKKKSGLFFTDLLVQCGWDSTLCQKKDNIKNASITFFYGGQKAHLFNKLPNKAFLKQSKEIINKNLEIDFDKTHNKKTIAMLWKDYPYAKCSYTSFKVGQWTKYTGVSQEPFENIYFAGEHCDVEFQGFMNGAIKSAKEVVKLLVKKISFIQN